MDLNLSSLGTLVPAAPCFVFYLLRHQIYWRFGTDDMVFWFYNLLLHTQKNTHRAHKDHRLTRRYKDILTPPVTCTQQLTALHWMNNLLIRKCISQRSTLSFLFKNYSVLEVIYLLIRFIKENSSFLWNTKTTDKNGINEQNTYTTYREKDNFKKS